MNFSFSCVGPPGNAPATQLVGLLTRAGLQGRHLRLRWPQHDAVLEACGYEAVTDDREGAPPPDRCDSSCQRKAQRRHRNGPRR